MEENQVSNFQILLKISNSSESNISLRIEPWGVENVIKGNSNYEFLIQGPENEILEIEYNKNEIVIYGWEDSTISARTEE